MPGADQLVMMAKYNRWANEQMIDFFRPLPESTLKSPQPGSFPSVYRTLLHIWDAQDIWYKRLHGENPTVFRSEENPGEGSLFDGLRKSSESFVILAENTPPSELDEVFSYITIAGGPQVSRRSEVLQHVFNHSTYHRGQCVNMARALELQGIPSTDLIRYLRVSPPS